MTEPYDGNLDAYLSWQLAIAEIRRGKLIKGELAPINDAERRLLEKRQ